MKIVLDSRVTCRPRTDKQTSRQTNATDQRASRELLAVFHKILPSSKRLEEMEIHCRACSILFRIRFSCHRTNIVKIAAFNMSSCFLATRTSISTGHHLQQSSVSWTMISWRRLQLTTARRAAVDWYSWSAKALATCASPAAMYS